MEPLVPPAPRVLPGPALAAAPAARAAAQPAGTCDGPMTQARRTLAPARPRSPLSAAAAAPPRPPASAPSPATADRTSLPDRALMPPSRVPLASPLALALSALLAVLLAVPAQAQVPDTTTRPVMVPADTTVRPMRDVVIDAEPATPVVYTPGAPGTPVPAGAVVLSIDEAVALAVERAYSVRLAVLDRENTELQVRQAYTQLYPRADASGSYTRNIVQANPFAGSSAGDIFGGLGSLDWLAYNEQARTDDDPETVPLTLEEFRERQAAGQTAAGFTSGSGGNPFGVENQFVGAVSITQTLFSGTALAAVRGADDLRAFSEAGLAAARADAALQARQLFYTALLAQERVVVLDAAIGRGRQTVREAALLVAQGVRPALDRLQAEVAVANLEAQRVQAEAAAATTRDQLLLAIGLPVGPAVVLRGALDTSDPALFRTVGLDVAARAALAQRANLQQARLGVRLREVDRNIARAAYYPTVSAFLDLAYLGNVPDNRTFLTQTGDFTYELNRNGFFSGAYFNPTVSAGLRVSWTIFDGFARRYTVQQREVAIRQAEVQLEQAEQAVALEVAQSIRDLESAQRRVAATAQTVRIARTAYDYAIQRLGQGVSTQLDVRQSSDALDQAQLNYLQAVYDALIARATLDRATGAPAAAPPGLAPPDTLPGTPSAPTPTPTGTTPAAPTGTPTGTGTGAPTGGGSGLAP